MTISKKDHWENIYDSKALNEVSWYQPIPKTSLNFIESCSLQRNSPIIDVGGGDSFLSDYLLKRDYEDISVLDISSKAIERAKKRQGKLSNKVNWKVSDVLDFSPTKEYAVWHDRAVFHFLRDEKDIKEYINILLKSLAQKGNLVLGTFAEDGPKRCCALDVRRYSFQNFENLLSKYFTIIKTQNVIHKTPFDTEQSFNFIHAIKK